MGTVVDNCNIALGLLGDRATLTSIDPPEGSAQADHCARFYPIARDELLGDADWSFASTYADLAQLAVTSTDGRFVYTLPADCLVVRELGYSNGAVARLLDGRIEGPAFEIATQGNSTVLLTALDVVVLRYTRRVVDPTKYSPKATTALHYLLASYLAGPVVKGKAGVQTSQSMRVMYQQMLSKADVVDANQSSGRMGFTPSSIGVRGHAGSDRIIERGQERYSLPFWARG